MLNFAIPVEELVRRGGGEAPFTQRLRRAFEIRDWPKREITIAKTVDGEERGIHDAHNRSCALY